MAMVYDRVELLEAGDGVFEKDPRSIMPSLGLDDGRRAGRV
jgi:hypothetical protein